MIFTASLSDLVQQYHSTWSGRCRGRERTAYTIDGDGLEFKADFIRWIERQMIKGDNMILSRTLDSDHFTILIFRKDPKPISPTRAVAEAILKFGGDPEGVPSSAINFCISGHMHSGGQRFREICQAYRRQWHGINQPAHGNPHHCQKSRFYFSKHFLCWLNENLDNIEKIVSPVRSRIKIKEEK